MVKRSGINEDCLIGVQKSARLKMSSRDEESEIKIHLKMTKFISVEAKSSDTIETIKNKVLMIEGVWERNQELVFAGNNLVDTKTLADYNISANSTIELLIGDDMRVYVKMPSMGKTVMLRVEKSATILHLKVKIQEMEGIDVSRQTLIYLGRVIADDETLLSNDILDNSTLNMVLRPVTDFCISISMASGKTFQIEARFWYTIWDVKNIIESLEKLPARQQKLVYAGKVLVNNLTLNDYNITEDSTLQLVECKQIFIKATKKILTLEVDISDTIAMVMEKIGQKLGFQLKHQVLYYAGKVLEEENSIGYYQIQDESTLHMNVRVSNMWEKDRISVLLNCGVVVSITVYPHDKIKDVKAQIEKCTHVKCCQIYDISERRKLHDDSTLEQSKIEIITDEPALYAEISFPRSLIK